MKESQVKKSYVPQGLPGGASVKKLTANADVRDVGSIPGLGRSPRVEKTTHSSILTWKITWPGESGGLQPKGLHRVRNA